MSREQPEYPDEIICRIEENLAILGPISILITTNFDKKNGQIVFGYQIVDQLKPKILDEDSDRDGIFDILRAIDEVLDAEANVE